MRDGMAHVSDKNNRWCSSFTVRALPDTILIDINLSNVIIAGCGLLSTPYVVYSAVSHLVHNIIGGPGRFFLGDISDTCVMGGPD